MPKSQPPYDSQDDASFPQVARLTWDMAAVNNRLGSIDERLEKLDARFDVFSGNFVTQREFMIVRNIVFGFVGIVLVGFLTAVAALVYRGGG